MFILRRRQKKRKKNFLSKGSHYLLFCFSHLQNSVYVVAVSYYCYCFCFCFCVNHNKFPMGSHVISMWLVYFSKNKISINSSSHSFSALNVLSLAEVCLYYKETTYTIRFYCVSVVGVVVLNCVVWFTLKKRKGSPPSSPLPFCN